MIDYGTDGEGSVGYTLELSGDDIGSGLYALDATDTDAGDGDGIGQGSEILLSADGDDIVGMADGVEYFRISVDGDGDVTFEQSNNIWHDTTSDDDEPETLTLSDEDTFEVVQTVTDADGDSDTAAVSLGSGVFTIQDDGPDAVVEDTTVAELVLDESPVDDPDTVVVEGDGVVSATVNVAGNFGALIDYGTDGEGSVGYTLELSGDDIGSGLYALDATDTDAGDGDGIGQGSEILLSADGDDIVGMADGVEYFRISVDGDGDVTFEQSNNIWHDTTSDDDEPETLTLSDEDTFEVVQTVTDADGDSDTAAVSLGSGVFTIQDDGPDAVVEDTTVAELVLDESPVDDPDTVVVEGDGVVSATVNVAGNFGALIDYGTDGEGSVGYTLELSGDDIGSGLYALDATDTDAGDGDGIGQGSEILLSADGDDIVGMADGVEYFRISVDGDGDVTFEQSNNIWHDTTSDDDEPETLTLSDEDTFEVVQTVTDADGDSDTAAVSLGSGVFTIQDDGPDAVVEDTTVAELVLDESPVDDPDTVVVEGDGVVSATVNVAGNFGALIDYGTDGEGSVGYTLELSGDDIGSGLYALDATDTDAGDGDGIGQGSEILLSADGDDIVGMADGVEYFRISVDGDGDVTFEQSNNIWHDTTSDDDEPETLTLSDEDTFEVVQTVTDADGDSDTAAVSLGSGVFTIQDDGPSAFAPGMATITNPGVVGNSDEVDADLNLTLGTDLDGTVVFDPSLDGQAVTDTNGNALFFNGSQLFYTLSGDQLIAETAGGTDGFIVTLNGDGTYSVDLEGEIRNGDEFTFNVQGSGIGGGNEVGVALVEDTMAVSDGVIFTGTANGSLSTVNTSQGRLGVGGGQAIDSGDVIRADFVTDVTLDGGTQSGFGYGTHQQVSSVLQEVNRIGGSGTTSFTITAYNTDEDDILILDNPADNQLVSLSVADITIYDGDPDAGGSVVANGTMGLSITENDGVITVAGMQEGWYYEVNSSDTFEAIEIAYVSGGGFTLGDISVGTLNVQGDFNIEIPVTATDADGDSIDADLNLFFDTPDPLIAKTSAFDSLAEFTADVDGGEFGDLSMTRSSSSNMMDMAAMMTMVAVVNEMTVDGFEFSPLQALSIDGSDLLMAQFDNGFEALSPAAFEFAQSGPLAGMGGLEPVDFGGMAELSTQGFGLGGEFTLDGLASKLADINASDALENVQQALDGHEFDLGAAMQELPQFMDAIGGEFTPELAGDMAGLMPGLVQQLEGADLSAMGDEELLEAFFDNGMDGLLDQMPGFDGADNANHSFTSGDNGAINTTGGGETGFYSVDVSGSLDVGSNIQIMDDGHIMMLANSITGA